MNPSSNPTNMIQIQATFEQKEYKVTNNLNFNSYSSREYDMSQHQTNLRNGCYYDITWDVLVQASSLRAVIFLLLSLNLCKVLSNLTLADTHSEKFPGECRSRSTQLPSRSQPHDCFMIRKVVEFCTRTH